MRLRVLPEHSNQPGLAQRAIEGDNTGCTSQRKLLNLQNDLGCHNITFVSPSHFVPQILQNAIDCHPDGVENPLSLQYGGYD